MVKIPLSSYDFENNPNLRPGITFDMTNLIGVSSVIKVAESRDEIVGNILSEIGVIFAKIFQG